MIKGVHAIAAEVCPSDHRAGREIIKYLYGHFGCDI